MSLQRFYPLEVVNFQLQIINAFNFNNKSYKFSFFNKSNSPSMGNQNSQIDMIWTSDNQYHQNQQKIQLGFTQERDNIYLSSIPLQQDDFIASMIASPNQQNDAIISRPSQNQENKKENKQIQQNLSITFSIKNQQQSKQDDLPSKKTRRINNFLPPCKKIILDYLKKQKNAKLNELIKKWQKRKANRKLFDEFFDQIPKQVMNQFFASNYLNRNLTQMRRNKKSPETMLIYLLNADSIKNSYETRKCQMTKQVYNKDIEKGCRIKNVQYNQVDLFN